jgi:hypothetical protein
VGVGSWMRVEFFLVKSAYSLLVEVFLNKVDMGGLEGRLYHNIWKCLTPSKAITFSSKLLHSRIPSRSNLARRGIIHLEI